MIFVVDEDGEYRRHVAERLRASGYRVGEFASAGEVRAAAAEGIRCLITDYRVGGADGVGLADEFHAAHPHAPVLILSADREVARDANIHGRDFLYFFCKPLSGDVLARVVATLAPATGRAAA
jgi:DNA-binding NtrC family response regulator